MPVQKIFRRLLKRNLSLKSEATKATHVIKQIWHLIRLVFSYNLTKLIVLTGLVLLIAPVLVFLAFKPQTQDEILYGITFSNKYSTDLKQDWKHTYIKILDDLSVRHLRLIAYWDEIESEPGVYNFENIKWQLEEAQKRNANVILSMGRKVPRYPECFEPKWWKELKDQNAKEQELMNYLEQTVSELNKYSVIKKWQVENEPFFPFGVCEPIYYETVKKEIALVRSLDKRPILVQDSGEGGFWFPSYSLGDYLGVSMYRKIWYDFWGVFLGKHIYFQYPLAHWTYHIKAKMLGIDPKRVIVTELQAEPWGPGFVSEISKKEKDNTMSEELFIDTINYAQKAGFEEYYLWGAEWWLWEKENANNSFYWDTARALFNSSGK